MRYTSKLEGLDEALNMLSSLPKVSEAVLLDTIKTVAKQGYSAGVKAIRQEHVVKSARIKQDLKLYNARRDRLLAEIVGKRQPLGIQHFAGRQTKKGYSYQLPRGSRHVNRGAFLAIMPRGGAGVFARDGKARLPISKQVGPSVGGIYHVHGLPAVNKYIQTNFKRIYLSRINYRLSKLAARGRR